MHSFPPPDPTTGSHTSGMSDQAAARVPLMSRRRLLIGTAGSLVVVAGGISAVYASGSRPRSAGSDVPTPTGGAATVPSSSTAPDSSVGQATVPSTAAPPAAVDGRILVVLQLGGGNDALNTLIPVTGSYHDARPSLALTDDDLMALPFSSGYGLHPALSPLDPLLAAGQLGVVAGIGFDDPDRSHFKSLDMWWSAAPGETFRTGWIGRWLDATAMANDDPLRSIGLGGAVPALRAETARSIGVNEVAQFALRDAASAPSLIDAWSALSPDHAAARRATEVFAGLTAPTGLPAGLPADLPTEVGSDQPATERLLTAAQLIAAEPDVRVIHVAVSGFDTHSNQLLTHERLLGDVAQGIARFQSAIEASGHADRVLLITTSEFGRRVVANGSGGTDHGKAGVQFVVGRGVSVPSVFGSIDPTDQIDGDLRPLIDPRSLYATALDWLSGQAASTTTDAVLGMAYERLPFL